MPSDHHCFIVSLFSGLFPLMDELQPETAMQKKI